MVQWQFPALVNGTCECACQDITGCEPYCLVCDDVKIYPPNMNVDTCTLFSPFDNTYSNNGDCSFNWGLGNINHAMYDRMADIINKVRKPKKDGGCGYSQAEIYVHAKYGEGDEEQDCNHSYSWNISGYHDGYTSLGYVGSCPTICVPVSATSGGDYTYQCNVDNYLSDWPGTVGGGLCDYCLSSLLATFCSDITFAWFTDTQSLDIVLGLDHIFAEQGWSAGDSWPPPTSGTLCEWHFGQVLSVGAAPVTGGLRPFLDDNNLLTPGYKTCSWYCGWPGCTIPWAPPSSYFDTDGIHVYVDQIEDSNCQFNLDSNYGGFPSISDLSFQFWKDGQYYPAEYDFYFSDSFYRAGEVVIFKTDRERYGAKWEWNGIWTFNYDSNLNVQLEDCCCEYAFADVMFAATYEISAAAVPTSGETIYTGIPATSGYSCFVGPPCSGAPTSGCCPSGTDEWYDVPEYDFATQSFQFDTDSTCPFPFSPEWGMWFEFERVHHGDILLTITDPVTAGYGTLDFTVYEVDDGQSGYIPCDCQSAGYGYSVPCSAYGPAYPVHYSAPLSTDRKYAVYVYNYSGDRPDCRFKIIDGVCPS